MAYSHGEEQRGSEEMTGREYKDGLPVIDSSEYGRLYNTDIRALGTEQAATFDYQGYVKEDREGYRKGIAYKDVLATNGLLRELGEPGIHIGIDGIRDYHDLEPMDRQGQVGEYDIYITIPAAVQKAKNCFCKYDSCKPLKDWDNEYDGDLEEYYKTSSDGYVVIRLSLDPKEDPLARQKVQVINSAIIKHIEQGRPLHEIQSMVRDLEDQLESIKPDALNKKATELAA